MITKKNIIISEADIDYLADKYIQLKKNRGFRKRYKEFKDYIDNFLNEQVSSINNKKNNA